MRCCSSGGGPTRLAATPPPQSRPGRSRRLITFVQWVAQWAIPLTTLALIPKCPACVAGYVLLFTGIGLSLPTAAAIRWILIALSVVALAYILVRTLRRAFLRFVMS